MQNSSNQDIRASPHLPRALDSYAFDLMQRHDPDLTARIRIVESTDAAPIPFLMASRQCPDDVVTSLQTALIEFGEIAACDALRERLCLQSFAPVVITEYDLMMPWNIGARMAGYAHPG